MRRPLSHLMPGLLLMPLALLVACSKPASKAIEGLHTFGYLGADVRSGSLVYRENPPVGGPYNAFWQTCRAYSKPIYDEYAVHSLARGAIWVTYRPGLDAAQVQQLSTLLAGTVKAPKPATPNATSGANDQNQTIPIKGLLSPRDNLPAPIVMTAWNAQITAQTADDPRLKDFVEQYGAGDQVPEAGASCAGGFDETR